MWYIHLRVRLPFSSTSATFVSEGTLVKEKAHCESFARKEEEIRRMGRRFFRLNVLPHHALVITYENNRVICIHQ